MQLINAQPVSSWNDLYKLGGTTVLIAVVIVLRKNSVWFRRGTYFSLA